MPSKKKAATKAPAATAKTPTIPLGRSAFPANVLPTDADLSAPAGAVALQVPIDQQKAPKPGSSTITMMNPTPTAAAPISPPKPKRG